MEQLPVHIKKRLLDQAMIASIARIYWRHMRRYPRAALTVLVSVVATSSTALVVPLFLKKFFDIASSARIPPDEKTVTALFTVLIVLGIFALISWCFFRITGRINLYFEAHVMADLLTTAFNNLLSHSHKFFSENFTGSLVRKVSRLSHAFETITDQITGQLIPLLVTALGILIVLLWRNMWLGLILLGWIVVFVATQYLLAVWKVKFDRLKAEKDSEATGVISDALANIVTVKLFSHYSHERERYGKVTSQLRDLRMLAWRIGENMDALQSAFMLVIEFAFYFLWLRLWKQGILTLGDFALIQGLLIVLMHRLWEFGRVVRRIYEGLADASEMVEILMMTPDIQDHRGAKALRVGQGNIEFKNVDFSFHQTRAILDRFNLVIQPGEKVALVGPSGAGKSTVVRLLLRLHDVNAGGIYIDGQEIAGVTQDSLRGQIAFVPQEPILFHRTLMENIRYGRLEATDKEVIQAAKKSHCHEFISQFPQGYGTYVGERGVKLSGGERQRVAIARAFLKNAPILILDEATSSLDSEVEALIQDALRTLIQKKTTIVIAHRLSTIRTMDRIVVIQGGKVTAEGPHQELLKEEGIYKKLWRIQAGGFAKN